jgi:hypothetical protein
LRRFPRAISSANIWITPPSIGDSPGPALPLLTFWDRADNPLTGVADPKVRAINSPA